MGHRYRSFPRGRAAYYGGCPYIIGEVLDSLHIQSVPKTSGATGVQIYIPIQHGYTFEQLRRIGHFIGAFVVKKYPNLFTIERFKKNRGDNIYVDYLQHWYGKTLSAPYTPPRAKKDASVSTPLLWKEVELRPSIRDFNLTYGDETVENVRRPIEKVPPQNLNTILERLT